MRRQSERYAVRMPLEVFASGRKHAAELEDLSRTGMFLRVPDLAPPAGTVIHVAFTDGTQRFVSSGHVAHALDETDAHALGRRVGIGIALRPATRPNDKLFSIAVDRLLARHAKQESLQRGRRIVIATSHVRLLERLTGAFGEAGFAVGTAANGLEAIATCVRARPDVLLVERVLPIVDGCDVVAHPKLAGLPIVMMSDDPADGVRALELGAEDYIAKPFSTTELVLRVRRLVRNVMLRGELSAIALPALLTLFEYERTSGQLVLTAPGVQAAIDLVAGRIVDARSTALAADPHTVVMSLLDWTAGRFELTSDDRLDLAPRTLALPIMQLLLEHARHRDEAARALAM